MQNPCLLHLWALLGFLLIGLQPYGSFSCLDEERVALLKIKDAFNYPDGSALSLWGDEEVDCCKWERVVCDNFTKRVTELYLQDTREQKLSDIVFFLDASLFHPFQELQKLYLENNTLQGIKGELRLKKLQKLSLALNQLTEIPSLGELLSLKYLNLGYNYLENLPDFRKLTNLHTLETLNLKYNQIRGIVTPSIGALTSLKAVSFANNELNGSLPREGFCSLRNIEELDLSSNGFEGSIPSCFSNMTFLKFLKLSSNRFGGTIPSTLFSRLTSLEHVSLSDNFFEGSFLFSSFANNSKLKYFEVVCFNRLLKIDTENPPWTPLFQLKLLRISDCELNEPSWVMPSFIVTQRDLRLLDLGNNSIIGSIPTWLLMNNSGLQNLILRDNFLTGSFILHSEYRFVNLSWLDVSLNKIYGELPRSMGFIFPNLVFLFLSGNAFQGTIPPSVGDMRKLYLLDLSDNNFSGELPVNLIIGCISLRFLKVSNNSLEGKLFRSEWNLTNLHLLSMENNLFSGELSDGLLNSSRIEILFLNNNLISGKIPDWIGNFSSLGYLSFANNSLEGSIPLSFSRFQRLRVLSLSGNILRSIPPSVNLSSLKYLHLQDNELVGPLPSFISRLSSLVSLDVRHNKLSGSIPSWLSFPSNLRILLLKGNNLEASIPPKLCQLKNISILDLSFNKLSGYLPPCLCSIPFGKKTPFPIDGAFETSDYVWPVPQQVTYTYDSPLGLYSFVTVSVIKFTMGDEVEFFSRSRYDTYTRSILYFISGIDLSHNKFIGPVPPEMGYLSGIHTLNLSHNLFSGSIPKTLSGLKEIQSLDLSYNRLTGEIPPDLIQLNFLSVFSVAYNNLSGRTPDRKGQFATFDEKSYEGNYLLCGEPLPNCGTSRLSEPSDQENGDSFKVAFQWSFLGSYIVAFLGVVAFLYYDPYHSMLLFEFIKARFRIFVPPFRRR